MTRLLSVIGHGVDLLPHFIEHYEKDVDEINIIIYVSELNPSLEEEIMEVLLDYPDVVVIDVINNRKFDWDKVTELYNKTKAKKPDDWWIIADVDEFHLYPKDDLKELIEDCEKNGWEIVRGGFIDRIGEDGEFSPIEKKSSIFKQFPNAGFFRYPMSQACPNKICVMKGYIELTGGQHYAKINGATTWRWQGWSHPLIAPYEKYSVQVHHFKWDETSIERIKDVADVNEKYAFSIEYKLMYDSLKKSKFRINLTDPDYMFEETDGKSKYSKYEGWDSLIRKIVSI